MYNSELKEKFIEEFSTNVGRRHLATVMFNTLESFETEWKADICTVDKEKLKHAVGEIIGFREKSKKTRLTILKEYMRWCVNNGVDGACNAIFEVDDFGLEKLKRQMVANPQHLQRYLNCICDKESEETTDCTYRCLYWLAYGGVETEEAALEILDTDVDFTEMLVKHAGDAFPIYREAIPAFKKCVDLREFNYKHPNYNKVLIKERAKGHYLLRGITETKSYKAMRVEMSRKIKNAKFMSEKDKSDESLQLKLSYYRVWLSGLFYRMYEAERAGMPVDFTAAAGRFMEGKTYKLDSGRNLIGAKQRQLAQDYLNDYNRWKEVYCGALVVSGRKNVPMFITIDGVTLALNEWCKKYGISYSAAYNRIQRGWEPLNALTTPIVKSEIRLTIDGETHTLSEWCKEYQMPVKLVYERIFKYGWEPDDALKKELDTKKSRPRNS